MERHLILVIDNKTGRILASRDVAEVLVDQLIEGLDVCVGRITTAQELRETLTQFGFRISAQTVAYRITGL